MIEILTALCLWIGSLLMLLAAIGLLRFPDLFTRMHAATKVGTVGIIFMVLSVAVFFGDFGLTVRAFLVIAFFFLTAPIAAQIIGRSAYIIGVPFWEKTVCDEFAPEARDAMRRKKEDGEGNTPEP